MDRTLKRGNADRRAADKLTKWRSRAAVCGLEVETPLLIIIPSQQRGSNLATPAIEEHLPTAEKKKSYWKRDATTHTISAILERQWWKETAVYSTVNVKINPISLMVRFWRNISLQKSEWKGCKKLQMSHDCMGNRQWELSHLFLLLLCAASLSTLLSWTSCTNQQPVPFPTKSFFV